MSKYLVLALLLGSIDISEAKIRDIIPDKKVIEKSHTRKVRENLVDRCDHSNLLV